jgi:hypothetical protein
MSLLNYYDRIVWVNLAIYILYFIIKYLPAVVYFFIWLVKCCRKSNYSSSNSTGPPLPWLLLLVFGKQLGIKMNTNKLHRIFLRDTKVMSRSGQIMVFYVLIFGSVVLALGSALDLTLFSPSHICTEDRNIDCYPQLIRGANATTNLTMLISDIDTLSRPIPDCSYWNSEGVSSQVTFLCFQNKYFNFELFMAITGGLLAFAFIILNASIGFLLRITRSCMSKITSVPILAVRVIAIIVAVIVELVMALLCLVLAVVRTSVDEVEDDPGVVFLTMHASEILVIVGIVATLLWLPWEEYVKYQQEHRGSGGVSNALGGIELQNTLEKSPTKA